MFNLFPAFAHVTLLAAHAKASLMRVIAAVTSVTVDWQRGSSLAGRRRITMATGTGQRSVRTLESKLGARVMVKIPQLPGTRVVAAFATLPQRQLVLVFLQMAGQTLLARIAKARRLVAILASGQAVAAAQRKARAVVIEAVNLPVLIGMAIATFRANLALVFIVLLVAAQALH